MNRHLSACPTCNRGLDDAARAAMGLRNGELFNSMCPGRNGPHDLDAVQFNGHVTHRKKLGRLAIIDYKRGDFPLSLGSAILKAGTEGQWCEPAAESGKLRMLTIRWWVIDETAPHAGHVKAFREIRGWLWPDMYPDDADAADLAALGLRGEEPSPLVADLVAADDGWDEW